MRTTTSLSRLIEEGAIACDNGRLSANFPVFSAAVLEQAQGILAPLAEKNQRLYDGNLRNSGKNPPGYPS